MPHLDAETEARMTKFGIAFTAGLMLAGTFCPAAQAESVTVTGNAPQVCSLGGWTKISGPGTFSGSGSQAATNAYSNNDMVDGQAMSTLGAGQALVFHAPLLCNTAITWSVVTDKGAFRHDTIASAPGGFANQWLYSVLSGPYQSSGTSAASLESFDADGTPFSGEIHTVAPPRARTIAYFGLPITPLSQPT